MELYIAVFILGFSVGLAACRLALALYMNEWPDARCTYCRYLMEKKSRHKR